VAYRLYHLSSQDGAPGTVWSVIEADERESNSPVTVSSRTLVSPSDVAKGLREVVSQVKGGVGQYTASGMAVTVKGGLTAAELSERLEALALHIEDGFNFPAFVS
jgi:hypothetical protein